MIQLKFNSENRTIPVNGDKYKSLINLSIQLNAEIDLELMLGGIISETSLLLDAMEVSLFLVDQERNELYLRRNSNPDYPKISIPIGRGIIGSVAFDGEPINLRDAELDPRFENEVFGTVVRSILVAPVIGPDDEILGVLTAMNSRQGYFAFQEEEILSYLCKLVASAMERSATLNEHVELNKKLSHQARHDALTGLPNRIALEEKLEVKLEESRNEGYSLAVLFIDLDRFKLVNDTLGHSIGDILLRQVAHRLKTGVRMGDIVARLGGDEFVVVLATVKNEQSIIKISRKLLKSLQQPFFVEGQELYLSGSIGISLYPEHGNNVTELLRYADNAMYLVKENGKNNFRFFDEQVNRTEQKRLWLVTQLHKALEYNELILYYQPQLSLSTGKLTGMEALIRWRHPELGIISPGDFIPVAEETGLIIPIGKWVLEEACRQCLEWQRKGFPELKVSVNVSALQFSRDDFVAGVLKTVRKIGLAPESLEVELTEGILVGDIQGTVHKLMELKRAGLLIAIDDFGTGYSSLSYLQKLPIDILKIDKSFVTPIGHPINDNSQNQALLKMISTLGHSLGKRIIAEGVENEIQLELLRKLECQEFQGYIYSPPLDPEDFEQNVLAGKLEWAY